MRLYPEHVPKVEAALPFFRKAVEHWENLERKLGPFDLVRKGGLMLADDEAQLAFLERKAERERRRGLDVEILDRAALERAAPWVSPGIHGAELCRDEGMINPLLAVSCMSAELGRLGGETGDRSDPGNRGGKHGNRGRRRTKRLSRRTKPSSPRPGARDRSRGASGRPFRPWPSPCT